LRKKFEDYVEVMEMFFEAAGENDDVIYVALTEFSIESQELIYLILDIEHRIFESHKSDI